MQRYLVWVDVDVMPDVTLGPGGAANALNDLIEEYGGGFTLEDGTAGQLLRVAPSKDQ